jgi:hypothetical protein
MSKSDLTADELRQHLHYDPETGIFTWRVRARANVPCGTTAGTLDERGYVRIGYKTFYFRAHRLAWLYVHGEWPAREIDHINGDKADNRIANLRPATHKQNSANRLINKNSTSGVKGVGWHKNNAKWRAQIKLNGKKKNLGYFDAIEDAAAAYQNAAINNFGEFANIGGGS